MVSPQTYVLVKWQYAVLFEHFSCVKSVLKEDPCKNEMWQLVAFKTLILIWYKSVSSWFCTSYSLVFLQVGIVLLITLSLKIMFDAPKSERALVAGCGWNCRRKGCGKDTNSGNVCKRIGGCVYFLSALGTAEVGILLLIWNWELSNHVYRYKDMALMLCI